MRTSNTTFQTALPLLVLILFAGIAHAQPAPMPGAGSLSALTVHQEYEARRDSSSHPDLTRNGDAWHIPEGASITLMEEEGPGMITHFWNTVGSYDFFYARALVVRIYYDGMEEPSVEVPLGDFFGVGHGAHKDFTSLPVATSSNGRSRVCYWQMPFRESIKVTVTNENKAIDVNSFYFYINWRKMDELPEDTVYFHARYRQETPAQPGNYKVLKTEGRGHYVGTVLSNFQMETGWFGEGDDFFYIDGAEYPQLLGTGTEDYFNDAWGFREFHTPFHGVTLYEGVFTGDRVSAYRWHITDPVPFSESLYLEFEHKGSIFDDQAPITDFEVGGFIERYDWVSSVAYWYQYPPVVSEEPFPSFEERVQPHTIIMASEMDFRADPPLLVMPQDPAVAYLPIEEGDAYIEFDFEVEEDGRYRVDGVFMYSVMSGVYQIYMNGKPVGPPTDFGAIGMDPIFQLLDMFEFEAGTQTIRFERVDQLSRFARNLAPAENGMMFIGLTLTHLDSMEGYLKALHKERPPQ